MAKKLQQRWQKLKHTYQTKKQQKRQNMPSKPSRLQTMKQNMKTKTQQATKLESLNKIAADSIVGALAAFLIIKWGIVDSGSGWQFLILGCCILLIFVLLKWDINTLNPEYGLHFYFRFIINIILCFSITWLICIANTDSAYHQWNYIITVFFMTLPEVIIVDKLLGKHANP